ncbi:hypothetical protein DPMN_059895 [Dreissena polymorpha]|uniref:Uncharacterized protein n=1 Tax=Dreissena polymorpha TaxID=45954 RepID=A0A9D4C487_DREPO|nr:hypothetical protein DPMN_059895 [Dreissena polymorpha]
MVSTDNTSVVAYIQAQGVTHSHSLYLETMNLLVLCKSLNISLSAKLILGRFNSLADGLSRKHQLFCRSGHSIRKWSTRFFSRSVIHLSTCLRPETTTDFLCM